MFKSRILNLNIQNLTHRIVVTGSNELKPLLYSISIGYSLGLPDAQNLRAATVVSELSYNIFYRKQKVGSLCSNSLDRDNNLTW